MDKKRLLELAGVDKQKGYHTNIEQETEDNKFYRRVLFTTPHNQLVVMSLLPEEEIGSEVHKDTSQFIRVELGTGVAVIDDSRFDLQAGDAIVIPAGTQHNIINKSKEDTLQIYTIYSPPVHKEGVKFKTKKEAESS